MLSVYPNPFLDHVKVEVDSARQDDVVLRLADVNGRLIKLIGWQLQKGKNILLIDHLDHVTNGIYLLDVLTQDGAMMERTKLFKYSASAAGDASPDENN